MITHDQWMKDTYVLTKMRSKELQAVDQALKEYHAPGGDPAAKQKKLQDAFEAWKKSKGNNWRSSDRNKFRAIEKMDLELNQKTQKKVLSQDELDGLKFIAEHNQQNLKNLLGGKKLVLKRTSTVGSIEDVRSALGDLKSGAGKIYTAAKGGASSGLLNTSLEDLLKSLFDTSDISVVKEALGSSFTDFLGAAAPVLGYVKDGIGIVKEWSTVAKSAWQKHKAKDARDSFAPGDPAAAFAAMLVIMDREIANNVATASITTVSFTVNTALVATGAGAIGSPIVGVVKTLAQLVQKIYLFARDWKEMKAANALLAKGVADLSLFKTCPLLAAYLISCSDTSALVNMAVSEWGRPGWTLDVEAMWRKAEPVYSKSREVVQGSRFEIPELKGYKGTVADKTATTFKIPTGKLDAIKQKIANKINA